MSDFTAPPGYLQYGEFCHNINRDKVCPFLLDNGSECRVEFTGSPMTKYCPAHQKANKMKKRPRVQRRYSQFAKALRK